MCIRGTLKFLQFGFRKVSDRNLYMCVLKGGGDKRERDDDGDDDVQQRRISIRGRVTSSHQILSSVLGEKI